MSDDSPHAALNPVEQWGIHIREMRTAQHLSVRGLGKAVGFSGAYVSNVENGKLVPSPRFAVGCDRVFGTGTLLAEQLVQAIEGDHPTWFVPYLQYERRATEINIYSTLYVPGLLQTPEYAHALYRRGAPRFTAPVIEAKVADRAKRREIFDRVDPPPPVLWAVLHEACLRVAVGNRGVMARQLQRLLEDAERPFMTLQFLPFEAAPATDSPFTLLTFTKGPTVLHAEGPHGARPQEAAKITSAAVKTYERLRAEALGQDESLTRIETIMKGYSS